MIFKGLCEHSAIASLALAQRPAQGPTTQASAFLKYHTPTQIYTVLLFVRAIEPNCGREQCPCLTSALQNSIGICRLVPSV
jgi:hypothetical protein